VHDNEKARLTGYSNLDNWEKGYNFSRKIPKSELAARVSEGDFAAPSRLLG
jgi:hypothetical protein